MNSVKESSNKVISQKEYLKRYLTKTKIKKRPIKRANVKVIDDNDLTSHFTENNHELETGEDAPVIAAVIDERPKTIQRLEAYKTSNRWAPVPEINEVSKSFSEKKYQSDQNEKGNNHGNSRLKTEDTFKKNERRSSNINDSTHRNRSRSSEKSHLKDGEESNFFNKKEKYIVSPERKSVLQKREYSSDESCSSHRMKYSREDEKVNYEKISKNKSFRDKSRSAEQNREKKRKKNRNTSPVKEKRSRYSSNSSVKKKKDKDLSEYSLSTSRESRRKIKTRGSDLESTPLHYDKVKKKKKNSHDLSPKIKIVKRSSSSSSFSSDQCDDERHRRYFDRKEKSDPAVSFEKNRNDYKKKNEQGINLSRKRHSPDSRPSHNKNENENLDKINRQENSSPVGKRDLRQDDHKVTAENNENNKKPTAEQYYQWGKGLKQIKDEDEKLAYNLHEMAKPLARYVDDEDLDRHLKCIERDGDPLAVIKRNKDEDASNDGTKPRYKGTYPQNRFGIAPGHKWDGVDRSNGYEVKWLGKAKAKEAVEEEAYKWSTADM